MKRLCLLLAFGLGTWGIYAQNLTKAEYFIDTDPGVGAGVNVPFTAATSITDLQVSVPVAAFGNGLHPIFFRVRDANNVWSTTERTYFYKAVIPTIIETPTPAAVNITKAEYFIDTDPGAGLGANIPITSGLTITDVALPVPVSALTEGLHQLLVRVRNASGVWSTTERTYFYKLAIPTITETPTPAAVNLIKAEYFIDTDPGIGLATNIPITSGLAVSDVVLQVPVTSLSEGLHQLLVRVRNASGVWSTTERTYFYRKTIPTIAGTPTPAAVNINKAEYFIDTDPGVGAGTNITITAGTTITDLITPVSVSSLSEGTHKLYLRVRNANLVWSTTEVASFSLCNGNVPVSAAASAITTSGFTANWASTSGALSYELDVSADDFTTFVSGYNAKIVNAPITSVTVTGLSDATTYKYRVRGFRTCASVSSAVITVGVPVATPVSQPTAINFPAPGPTDINVAFTPPATLPSGYLVVRRLGAYSTFVPVNNTSYNKGQVVGNGVVASFDPAPLFDDTGLSPNTNYYYSVYAYNQKNGFISYQTVAPLKGNSFTLALEPASQATNLQFTSVTSTSYTVSYTAATGNPAGYLVLRSAASDPASVPVDGTAYTGTIGADAIVYQGGALTFNEANLSENTTYYYAVYAFNGSGISLNYQSLSPLRGNVLTPLTPPATPTGLQFTATTLSITGTFTSAGTPSGYLIVRKQGATASTFVPQLNTSYSAGAVTDGTIIYVGQNASFTDTGLTASTQYSYSIFSYRQIGSLISYQATSLKGSQSTFTAEPTAQPTALAFNTVTTTSLKLTFTAASGAPTGYLVVRKAGAAPTALPSDGTAYVAGNSIGDGTVVYVGNLTTVTDAGLTPGTTYYYQVFSYNGTGAATNYLTAVTSANSGSKITVPDKPLAGAATAVQQKQFTANWAATTGADSYRLDVSTDNFSTRIAGFDDLLVAGISKDVSGLTPGTTYQYRVRAVNTSGTSVNSDVISQITVPYTPKYKPATLDPQTGQTIFSANWNAAKGATEYFLDVSSANNFSTFVSGFQNKPLGNVATVQINGLSAGLTYFYRLRSLNAGGTSPDSTAVTQLMIPATPVGLDATNTTTTGFKAKWQAATGATDYLLDVSLASDNFSTTLSAYTKLSSGGQLELFVTGLVANTAYKYRVWAVNASGQTPTSSDPIAVSTLDVGNTGPGTQPIPGLSSGGTAESYRMFSIPWQLQSAAAYKIETIFVALGKPADDKWKLLSWNSALKTWDRYPENLTSLERGKSYWFNSMSPPSASVTGNAYSDASFNLSLKQGWNQIGSPYDFDISWTDVLTLNSNPANVETSLYKFTPNTSQNFTETDNLKAWSGNYLFNGGNAISLTIPSTVKHANGRVMSPEQSNSFGADEWLLPLTLTSGNVVNTLIGFGMHPEASTSYDRHDRIALPRFVQYLELNTEHPEFFEPGFARDVVTTQKSFNWHFMAETNLENSHVTLTWDKDILAASEAQLILFDPQKGALLDMKKVSSHDFEINEKHPLHLFYAAPGENLRPDITTLVTAYPNPIATIVTFPYFASGTGTIVIEITDMLGRKIKTLQRNPTTSGLFQEQWDATDEEGKRVAPGLYIYRFMAVKNQAQVGKLIVE